MTYIHSRSITDLNKKLIEACKQKYISNQIYHIKTAIEYCSNIDYALYFIATNKYRDIAKHLIKEEGANVNVKDGAVLIYYVKNGDEEMVKLLVNHDVNIFVNDNYALRISVKKGNLGIVKCFVENGADIHANNDAAIRIARKYEHEDIIEYFHECIKKEREHEKSEYSLRY
jgi:Ankyrin repeats (3 copies)